MRTLIGNLQNYLAPLETVIIDLQPIASDLLTSVGDNLLTPGFISMLSWVICSHSSHDSRHCNMDTPLIIADWLVAVSIISLDVFILRQRKRHTHETQPILRTNSRLSIQSDEDDIMTPLTNSIPIPNRNQLLCFFTGTTVYLCIKEGFMVFYLTSLAFQATQSLHSSHNGYDKNYMRVEFFWPVLTYGLLSRFSNIISQQRRRFRYACYDRNNIAEDPVVMTLIQRARQPLTAAESLFILNENFINMTLPLTANWMICIHTEDANGSACNLSINRLLLNCLILSTVCVGTDLVLYYKEKQHDLQPRATQLVEKMEGQTQILVDEIGEAEGEERTVETNTETITPSIYHKVNGTLFKTKRIIDSFIIISLFFSAANAVSNADNNHLSTDHEQSPLYYITVTAFLLIIIFGNNPYILQEEAAIIDKLSEQLDESREASMNQ